jgi:hypothetical protein
MRVQLFHFSGGLKRVCRGESLTAQAPYRRQKIEQDTPNMHISS